MVHPQRLQPDHAGPRPPWHQPARLPPAGGPVAPRGQTQWVKNVRAGGDAELRLGKQIEVIHPVEVPDADKAPILREYVRRWKAEVGQFFDGIDASSTDEELLGIAPGFPVFRLA